MIKYIHISCTNNLIFQSCSDTLLSSEEESSLPQYCNISVNVGLSFGCILVHLSIRPAKIPGHPLGLKTTPYYCHYLQNNKVPVKH